MFSRRKDAHQPPWRHEMSGRGPFSQKQIFPFGHITCWRTNFAKKVFHWHLPDW